MKIEYDNEVDALQIWFADAKPVDSRDVAEGVTIDLDENGNIVGLEILDAVDKLGLESILNVSIENMPLERLPA
jgi:uncharacterized protein YuzE